MCIDEEVVVGRVWIDIDECKGLFGNCIANTHGVFESTEVDIAALDAVIAEEIGGANGACVE